MITMFFGFVTIALFTSIAADVAETIARTHAAE